MARLVCELQTAKDTQMQGMLGKTSQEIDRIHERTTVIADLVQKLITERNKENKEIDLSELEGVIAQFQAEFQQETNYSDPFSGIYPGPLNKVPQGQVEQAVRSLQDLMTRDANLLQKLSRDSEYAMHLYTIISEALSRQKLDERTFTRNQKTN